MAEVINKSGSGVSLAGASQAAQVRPTVGSEGRVSVRPHDLSGLVNLIQQGAQGIQETAKQKKAAELSNLANQAALEQETISFEALNGSPSELVAGLAARNKTELGMDMPADVRQKLEGIAKERQRLVTMFEQIPEKDRQRKLDAAMRLHRISFLQDHPQYGLEALVASGKLDKMDTSVYFREEEAVRQREADNRKSMDDFYRAQGIYVPADTPTDVLLNDYNARYAPARQEYAANTRALEALKTRKDLDEGQREVAKQELLRKLRPGNVQGAYQFITGQLSNSLPPEQRIQQIEQFRLQFTQQVMEQEGIYDPAEAQKQYGNVFSLLDQAVDTISNKKPIEAVLSRVRLMEGAAKEQVYNRFGAAPALLGVLGPMAPILGDSILSELFNKPPPGQQGKIGWQMVEELGRFSAENLGSMSSGAQGTTSLGLSFDPYQPVTNYQTGTQRPSPVVTRDGERAVSVLNRAMIDGYMQLPPESQKQAADYWEKTVLSPYAANSGTAWADIMDAMDSPNFGAFLERSGKRDVPSPTVVINSRRYTQALIGQMNSVLAGSNITPAFNWNPKTNELSIDGASIATLPQPQRDALVLSVRRLSQGMRVLHTKFGQGNDIPSLFQELQILP